MGKVLRMARDNVIESEDRHKLFIIQHPLVYPYPGFYCFLTSATKTSALNNMALVVAYRKLEVTVRL